jgi:hypothetical protein
VVFGVTAAGVRIDRYHSSDQEDSFDSGFDPVWKAETNVLADQWTAELWIPFSQLRFNPRTDLTWGLNLYRFRPTLDEADYWILIPRTVRAWASRFGDVSGINGVVPPRRIEALPYVAGGSTLDGDRDRGNPFNDGANLEGRVGADIKMGLGPNLTLETALNPDFGQVEADPAEVNLTAFETRFPRSGRSSSRARSCSTSAIRTSITRAASARGRLVRRRRLRRLSEPEHDHRRRQADRPAAVEDVARVHRRGHRRRRGAGSRRPGSPSRARSRCRRTRITSSAACCRSLAVRVDGGIHRQLRASRLREGSRSPISTRAIASRRRQHAAALSRAAIRVSGLGRRIVLNGEPKAVERWQRSSSHYAQRPIATIRRSIRPRLRWRGGRCK